MPLRLPELALEAFGERDQVRDVGGGVVELRVAQRPRRPVGALLVLRQAHVEVALGDRGEADRRVAEELRADHRVEQAVEAEAAVALQHVEVVLRGVEDRADVRRCEELGRAAPASRARPSRSDRSGRSPAASRSARDRSCRSSGRSCPPRCRRRRSFSSREVAARAPRGPPPSRSARSRPKRPNPWRGNDLLGGGAAEERGDRSAAELAERGRPTESARRDRRRGRR